MPATAGPSHSKLLPNHRRCFDGRSLPDLGDKPTKVAPVWNAGPVGLNDSKDTLNFLDQLFAEVAGLFPENEIRLEGTETPLHRKVQEILAKHKRVSFSADSLPSTDLSSYPRPADDELLVDVKREAEGGFNPVSRVYQIRPEGGGVQATLRTEFVHDFKKLEYLVFPRIAAFSEAAWLPASSLKYEEFRTRLKSLDQRYRFSGINASKTYDPPVAQSLHDTVIRSSMTARPNHPAELIFDGRRETFFRSATNPRQGDHLTLEFPWPPPEPSRSQPACQAPPPTSWNWGCLNCRKTERSGIPRRLLSRETSNAPSRKQPAS